MSLLALGAVGCNITANRMAAWVSMEMTRVLRQDLYRRIQGLSCTQADQFSPSSLVSRLTNDTYNVHQMFDKVQRGGIRAPMLVLGGLILTFLLEPSLALVQLAVSLLTFLTITLVTRRGSPTTPELRRLWTRWCASYGRTPPGSGGKGPRLSGQGAGSL